MKRPLLKLLKIAGIALLTALIGSVTYVFFTGPKLPDDADAVIESVLNSEIPEFIRGTPGYVISDNHRIWYESISPEDTSNGAILLFMGMASDALGWPTAFIDGLVGSGYQVIRFDYRGTGMSDWVEDWKQKPYSLADLAEDAGVILDALQIQKAHLIGLSLGGMVAQEFAISNPDRALSLTSIMSSGDTADKELPGVSRRIPFDFLKAGIKYGLFQSEVNTIKMHIVARMILRGDAEYDIDVRGTAEQVLYNLRRRRGFNPNAAGQHDAAVKRSDSRYDELKHLAVPVLIIHGVNDPLVPIAHSEKLSTTIPNAKTRWFDNMGHDLPSYLVDAISKEIISHIGGDR